MNTPNKLTIVRILLAPVFMLLLLWPFPGHFFAAFAVFAIASLTDMLDGKLARRNNQITDFGKFLDPIADKMLTTAAFLGFIQLDIGYGVVWIALLVLVREFLVSSLRMIIAGDGRVVAADIWGKAKTVCQMAAILFALFFEGVMGLIPADSPWCVPMVAFYNVLLWGSAVLTILSGANYLIKNKSYINSRK